MKIGLDIHGVIDAEPKIFSSLSHDCVKKRWEVHIITGQEDTPELRRILAEYNIAYTHLFSITTYHKSIGTIITQDDDENPWMDEPLWNKSKGEYCARNNIDIHIDDSYTYGKYFETTYIKFIKTTDNSLYFLPLVFKFCDEVIKLWLKVPKE